MRKPLHALFLASILLLACAGGGPRAVRESPHGGSPPKPDPRRPRFAAILRAEDRRLIEPDLLIALSDPDPQIRAAAVLAVGRIADPGAPSRIEAALSDSAAEVRREAALFAGILEDHGADARLSALAGDRDDEVRARVACALGRLADPSGADALAQLLADPVPAVRCEACLAVWKLKDAAFAVDALLENVRSDDPYVRFGAAYALGRLGSGPAAASSGPAPSLLPPDSLNRVRAALVDLVIAREPEIRMQAARGLANPRTPLETSALGRLAGDQDGRVRVNAIRSLSFPGAPLEPFLNRALKDNDPHVVRAALDGLGRVGSADAVRTILEGLLREKRPWMLAAALASLSQASPSDAIGFAAGIADDADAAVRLAAVQALAGRREPEAIALGAKFLTDSDVAVQIAAVPVAARADGSLNAILAPVIASPDPVVRAAVADAVGERLAADRPESDAADLRVLLDSLWSDSLAREDTIPDPRLEILDAAGKDPTPAASRLIIARGLEDRAWIVRKRAADLLASRLGESHPDEPGPATDRPLEDYLKILEWAATPHAAVITVRRPGFRPARFTVVLDAASAPLTAWNFAQLAEQRFFDGQKVHRVVPNFVVQDGDPRGDGYGGPGYTIRDELGAVRYWAGTLGMASSGKDTAGSQWFVTLSAQPHLDGRYTAFGTVVQNLEGVVLRILPGDLIESVTVAEGDGTEPLPPQ